MRHRNVVTGYLFLQQTWPIPQMPLRSIVHQVSFLALLIRQNISDQVGDPNAVVAFSLLVRIWGECSTIHSLCLSFLEFLFFI